MTRDEAYDLIDHRLRAVYDDEAYAELSAALDLCFTDEVLRQQLAVEQCRATAGWDQIAELEKQLSDAIFRKETAIDVQGSLRRQLATLRAENAYLQSRIDARMLEFCPDEMTPEQVAECVAKEPA